MRHGWGKTSPGKKEKSVLDPDQLDRVNLVPAARAGGLVEGDRDHVACIVSVGDGDRLDEGNYVIRSISPTQVVVATTDGSKNLFILPLQETQ